MEYYDQANTSLDVEQFIERQLAEALCWWKAQEDIPPHIRKEFMNTYKIELTVTQVEPRWKVG